MRIEPDVTIRPGTQIKGATAIATRRGRSARTRRCVDCEIGANAVVKRTDATLAVIGAGASVGPFAYLRPGTLLGADGKIGTFVETKNARIGDGTQGAAPQLHRRRRRSARARTSAPARSSPTTTA